MLLNLYSLFLLLFSDPIKRKFQRSKKPEFILSGLQWDYLASDDLFFA